MTMTIRLADRDLCTRFGTFKEILYYDGQRESIVLVMGEVGEGADVLCRIHSACLGGHVFNSVECECAAEMAAAQKLIGEAGRGVIIYLDQEGKGNGHLALMLSIPFKEKGMSQSEAYEKAGFAADARRYDPVAQILKELGVKSVALLTDSTKKVANLIDLGVTVSDTRKLEID